MPPRPKIAVIGAGISGLTAAWRLMRLGADVQSANPAAKRRFLVRGGKPLLVPSGPGSLLASPLLSAGAKLRLLTEPFNRSRPPAGHRGKCRRPGDRRTRGAGLRHRGRSPSCGPVRPRSPRRPPPRSARCGGATATAATARVIGRCAPGRIAGGEPAGRPRACRAFRHTPAGNAPDDRRRCRSTRAQRR